MNDADSQGESARVSQSVAKWRRLTPSFNDVSFGIVGYLQLFVEHLLVHTGERTKETCAWKCHGSSDYAAGKIELESAIAGDGGRKTI